MTAGCAKRHQAHFDQTHSQIAGAFFISGISFGFWLRQRIDFDRTISTHPQQCHSERSEESTASDVESKRPHGFFAALRMTN
jgi:hypothetical protein